MGRLIALVFMAAVSNFSGLVLLSSIHVEFPAFKAPYTAFRLSLLSLRTRGRKIPAIMHLRSVIMLLNEYCG